MINHETHTKNICRVVANESNLVPITTNIFNGMRKIFIMVACKSWRVSGSVLACLETLRSNERSVDRESYACLNCDGIGGAFQDPFSQGLKYCKRV